MLLYASNAGAVEHPKASAFLGRCTRESEILCLAWTTLMSYVRISTHPSIFPHPLRPEEAFQNVERLIALPHARLLVEQEGFEAVYREITTGTSTRGNAVPDAHFAAILKQNGVRTLYSNDRDFRRFAFLDVRDPLSGS